MKKALIVSFKKTSINRNNFKAGKTVDNFQFKYSSESLYDNTLPGKHEMFRAGLENLTSQNKELIIIQEELEGFSDWDLAHLYYDEDKQKGFGEIGFIEPDLLDKYPMNPDENLIDLFKSGGNNNCIPEYYYGFWGKPTKPSNWHLDNSHSQLAQAWKAVKGMPGDTIVAHMDTGFDPNHISLPANILAQQNFVEGEAPDNASDPMSSKFLHQPGHGTATLALLAGSKSTVNYNNTGTVGSFEFEGAYPGAQMILLRISPTVILLKTSAVVRALDWILRSGKNIEVISMSMGGVAKKEWAEKVNQLYEKGIFYACASGDCFGGLPTHKTVYPARFNRVVSVCGAQYTNEEYFKSDSSKLMGSFGPSFVMEHAIAAYTPNVPWARAFCSPDVNGKNTGFSLQGGGTSASTPQVAAAAAMYLKKYRTVLKDYKGWEKVEAVRYALFKSAFDLPDDPNRSYKYFGQGILKANDALAIAPDRTKLSMIPEDSVNFPILRILFRANLHDDPTKQQMFELELMQLVQKSKELDAILGERSGFMELNDKEKLLFIDAVIGNPEASIALKNYLKMIFNR